jgi:hypothetical protein
MSGHGNQDADYLNGRYATATAGTGPAQTFTLADLERVEKMIRDMPNPPWTLIAPDGRAWQTTDPQALLRTLALEVFAGSPVGVTTCAGSCCDCGKGCAAAGVTPSDGSQRGEA